MSTISPLFISKCQHGQYRTLLNSCGYWTLNKYYYYYYLSPMPVFTKIIVLDIRYQKLSKSCTQLLRYKQPVPCLPVNASMDNTVL